MRSTPLSATAPGPARLLPVGFQIALVGDVRQYRSPDGGVLLGGSPLRVYRLGGGAWAELDALMADEPVRTTTAARVAGSLVDGGLCRPVPRRGSASTDEVTIVIPVRDRPTALRRCLHAVGPAAAVVVVDDASQEPQPVADAVADAGAQLCRRQRNGGPAAARNTGLARCRTEFVAFVDSDCTPEPGWLSALLPHFDDPLVAAVAPRVIGVDAPGWLGRYEQARSCLDLGVRAGPVQPCSRISYVPAAALVVRRAALGAGFREDLRVGEDVDLVWRLHGAGWRVRYEPAALVRHEHRARLRHWAGRKFAYGTSAGPLARRHPGQVPPAVTSGVALLPLALLRSRHPVWALAAAGLSATGLAKRLPPFPGRSREAARLAVAGCLTTGYGVVLAATRAWLPMTLAVAIRRPAARPAIFFGLAGGPALAWWTARPKLDPFRWGLAYLLDDACYCAGLWAGALRAGTVGPLLPRVPELTRWRRTRAARPGRSAPPVPPRVVPGSGPGVGSPTGTRKATGEDGSHDHSITRGEAPAEPRAGGGGHQHRRVG